MTWPGDTYCILHPAGLLISKGRECMSFAWPCFLLQCGGLPGEAAPGALPFLEVSSLLTELALQRNEKGLAEMAWKAIVTSTQETREKMVTARYGAQVGFLKHLNCLPCHVGAVHFLFLYLTCPAASKQCTVMAKKFRIYRDTKVRWSVHYLLLPDDLLSDHILLNLFPYKQNYKKKRSLTVSAILRAVIFL